MMRNTMASIGTKQRLRVIDVAPMGLYLALPEAGDKGKVLLPKKRIPEGTKVDDFIEVFLYKDSEDRPIATTQTPRLMMGQIAVLKVVQITKIGAFLDWGLEKDLFLPFKEQTYPVQKDDEVPVSLYIDKSNRLCATMHLYEKLSSNSPYQAGDYVDGVIYEILSNFGAFVAIELTYSALIPRSEMSRRLKVGESVHARIKEVREDGKLTLSLREKAHLQMDADALYILKRLKESDGFLPFHDNTPPEIIKHELNMSKSAYKRAIGRLYKNGNITISERGVSLNQDKK